MTKIALLLIFSFFNFSVFADSKIRNVKDVIDQLNSDLISAEFAPAHMSKKEILTMIKDTEELNSYLYQSFLEENYNSEKLKDYYFNNESWYPQFCDDLNKQEDIKKCFSTISNILQPLGKKFGFLYLNGDADSSDFKTMTLVFNEKEENQNLIVTLKVHEERN